MDVVRWPGAEGRAAVSSVATLGVFDGVHRGHAAVIGQVAEGAAARDCCAAVVTFDRHPASLISGRAQPAITSLDHKVRLFEGLGADLCVVVTFDRGMADMPAEDFARGVFVELLGARLLVLGTDCRFGRNREGDAEFCRRAGPEMGFKVRIVEPVVTAGRRISSTAIREAVLTGDFVGAEKLLGRPFSLYGTVVHGDGRGRDLGYPTANLDLHNETIPPDGVYAAWVYADGAALPGVVSVGRRATFHHEPDAERVVEVHILDGGLRLYGQDIEAQFVSLLRDQAVYATREELVEQIARDVAEARRLLGMA